MAKTAVTTLEKVGVNNKSLEAYRTIVGDEVIDEIKLVSPKEKILNKEIETELIRELNTDNASEIAVMRYDRVAAVYDFCEPITERFGWYKWRKLLWSKVEGNNILEVGVGTGKNFSYYPPDVDITAILFNPFQS